jgi:hypothetical protein
MPQVVLLWGREAMGRISRVERKAARVGFRAVGGIVGDFV